MKTIRIVLDLTPDEVDDLDDISWAHDVGPTDEGWQSPTRQRLRQKIQSAIETANKSAGVD